MRLDILLLLSFLFCVIGLLACSPPPNPTPTIPPTLFPSVTLTTYNPVVFTTLTPNPLPATTILPSFPLLSELDISPPQCYPHNPNQITCLGYVYNRSEYDVVGVTLNAKLIGSHMTVQAHERFTLEQRLVKQGEVAPYRIHIPNARLEETYLQIGIVSANISSEAPLPLHLNNMQGKYDLNKNRYEFTAELENTTAFDAMDSRLIVTLENEDGDIIGYRIADLPQEILSGNRISLRLIMTPLEATTTIRHRITLEAFPSDTSRIPEG